MSVLDSVKFFETSTASVVLATTPCVLPVFGLDDSEILVDFSIDSCSF
jgi:hypothetical protein